MKYTIGCDYGTLSMRAVLVSLQDGTVVAEHVYDYSNAVITDALPGSGVKLGAGDWALQDPEDYMRALDECIPAIIKESGVNPEDIVGLGVDFTTCTVMPMTEDGIPMCQLPDYKERPHAWPKLWKNHTAHHEAEKMTEYVAKNKLPHLDDYGYRMSAEWFFPKIWEVLKKDEDVYKTAYTFIEAGDYIVYKLVGEIKRSGVLAAAKSQFDNDTLSYPDKEFFRGLDPRLENVVEEKNLGKILQVGQKAGNVTPEMAKRLGLSTSTVVCVAHADAAVALVGAGITKPHQMIFAMGTSTCHIMLSETKVAIPGMGAVYKNGVLPGFYTYEAGQGAVGDIFDWFCKNYVPAEYAKEAQSRGIVLQKLLDEKAEALGIGTSGVLALDWMNGNRCILQDAGLTGLIMGMNMSTKAEAVYRALLEATAFGTRMITEQFKQYGVPINEIYACGGLAHKSAVVMQMYSDVLNTPINITAVKQTSALSIAIFAAVAAGGSSGGYDDYETAVQAMVKPPKCVYNPIPENVEKYNALFEVYKEMHDLMGREENSPMKKLRAIRGEI